MTWLQHVSSRTWDQVQSKDFYGWSDTSTSLNTYVLRQCVVPKQKNGSRAWAADAAAAPWAVVFPPLHQTDMLTYMLRYIEQIMGE